MQIEARIDQQTEISRELSLWDQRGSRIIRGNLLAIPVGNAFIYVEPIYLEAKQEPIRPIQPAPQAGVKPQKKSKARPARKDITTTAALPELKRLGNHVAMEEKLDAALSRVLGAEAARRKEVSPIPGTPETEKVTELGALALEYYNNAREYLQAGDWAGYGRELEKLESILKKLSKTSGENLQIMTAPYQV
jgi:uncharacterized membrane protein (UPF0182 family)